jgi:hypothetical protein
MVASALIHFGRHSHPRSIAHGLTIVSGEGPLIVPEGPRGSRAMMILATAQAEAITKLCAL